MLNATKIISTLIFICFAQYVFAQSNEGYLIKGKLKGIKDGSMIYLVRNTDNGGVDTVDKVLAFNESFIFKGSMTTEGEGYFIFIDSIRSHITLILENRQVSVEGCLDNLSLDSVKVSGLPSHFEYIDYKTLVKKKIEQSNYILKELNKARKRKDTAAVAKLDFELKLSRQKTQQTKIEWIKNHPNSIITPWVVKITYQDIEDFQNEYDKLGLEAKKGYWGIVLANEIQLRKNIALGSIAPNFSLPTVQGNILSLKDIVAKSKITLIDFWASWCGPCRSEFPRMKELYREYNTKGLSIIGYSTDMKEEDWKRAVTVDSINWYNVRQFGDDNLALKLYGVTKLPTSYLLDSEGRIIGKDLYGDMLLNKVKEILSR